MRIVLGVGGGIAAYKACSLLRHFSEAGHDVTVVPTASALHFVGEATWAALSGKPVSTDVWTRVHEVPHVRLGQEADLVVVAPATADLLSKAAHGMADDLLTTTLLTARCPVVLAPAMHTEMWLHPATVANVATLRSHGVHVIDPASGRLTGADSGPGRLPEPAEIAALCEDLLADAGSGHPSQAGEATSLAGRRVVVSAGGTHEPLDPVRFIGNRSSGKQGIALAQVAAERGAQVVLVTANVTLPVPAGVDQVRVETTLELEAAVRKSAVDADVVVMAAAPADFRPAHALGSKLKKSGDAGLTLELVQNPDIVAGLVAARDGARAPIIVSFAAETGDANGSVMDHARAKFARKGSDLQVVNEVGVHKTFGQDESTVHLLRRGTDEVTTVGPESKRVVAAAVWDAVRELLDTV
ncbi:bifunctional phosphopantothenoylcysteine decarboxylase/phosphopantothenate--cysteine ligase CoaBC [Leekyejoonella antrihumi]|uniref:Coenzyme A biosynthesis bifunctional protein CoaBC n=1 Tax=Leekyejoonella antrihumi TaxID=1660198 RepID=A0A563DX89_9MICO|nr:bifunctional phosphopantothenoylcysteine decarboxylase/phosphopantothenate--cysteine ligase CoaBC [Leekyejoonella antrihumi]TWP34836.1 bifunctional phosphopantothenoylcysteine decarboxylase/phosphopantothenate--cysteine ligase CoaBC [Leekyejoonella antrihumi]